MHTCAVCILSTVKDGHFPILINILKVISSLKGKNQNVRRPLLIDKKKLVNSTLVSFLMPNDQSRTTGSHSTQIALQTNKNSDISNASSSQHLSSSSTNRDSASQSATDAKDLPKKLKNDRYTRSQRNLRLIS